MADRIDAPMWDKMQVFCKRIADHQIRLILHFDKPLKEEVLKKAIKVTVGNNPIVCANYVETPQKALWHFNEIDMGRIYSCWQSGENSDDLLQEAIIGRIDTFEGPQVKITLIRSEADILVLNCNHAMTDAAGVKEFAAQLAHNYSYISAGETIDKKDYSPLRSLRILSRQLGTKEKISVLSVMLSSKKNAPTFRRETELVDFQTPGFKTYTIGAAEFDKIKGFGRKHSATVNDILLTAVYYTLKNIAGNSNKTNRLTYSADIRKYLGDADYDILSNFSAIHNIDIDNSISDFLGLLKEISAITKTRKQPQYSLADFPMMAMLFKTLSDQKIKSLFHKGFDKIKEGKADAPPSLSNIGVIEEDKLRFGAASPTQAYMLGGINHPSLLQVTVSTYKKHLTMSIGTYYSGKTNVLVSGFIDGLKTTIEDEVLGNIGAGI